MDQLLMTLSSALDQGLRLAGEIKAAESEEPSRRDSERLRTLEYFDLCLEKRFCAEEEILLPLVETCSLGPGEMVGLLKKQHSQLRGLIVQLRAASGGQLENLLLRFAQVLEAHLRKEEWLLKRLPREISEERLTACAQEMAEYLARKSGPTDSHA